MKFRCLPKAQNPLGVLVLSKKSSMLSKSVEKDQNFFNGRDHCQFGVQRRWQAEKAMVLMNGNQIKQKKTYDQISVLVCHIGTEISDVL